MSTKFFTNQDEKSSLLTKLEGVLDNISGIHHFDALVGYFRASGYFKLRRFLDKVPKIRMLVGINVDGLTKKYHDKGQLYMESPEETKKAFLKDVLENIKSANYDSDTEKGIIQFLDDLTTAKIEMRAHPKQKLHAKFYIFRPQSFNEHAPCEVITGSSNLTDAGLGTYADSNYEFNVSLRDYDDVKFATDEFERLWVESVPILEAEAAEIKAMSYLRDDFTPYEIYIKMLMEYFGKRVDYDPYNIDLLLPSIYKPLKYQSDAANQGYAIMMKHHGFILADVVGLGKTVIACMIIKKFVYENGTHTKVLVVVPPAIEAGWRSTARDFQLDNHFRYVTLGSMHKVTDPENQRYPNPPEIDLVVVDESHKFKNDYTDMYIELQDICKKPRSRPAEDGDTKKKVMLLSATPLNNAPSDIENQLYLFQDKRNSTLESTPDLQFYFTKVNKTYKEISAEPHLNIDKLRRLFENLRADIIEPLVIRRTRTDIENNEEYLDDITKHGITFPKVDDPIALKYQLSGTLAELFFKTVSMITGVDESGNETDDKVGYFRYRAIGFLSKEEHRAVYGNVESISGRLSAIMRTLLVKRLESSFFAFTRSLERLDRAIDNMLAMFDEDRVFVAPDLDINKLLEDDYNYDQIEAKVMEKGGNNREFVASDFDEKFVSCLLEDKKRIGDLVKEWQAVEEDPKLEDFKIHLKSTFFKKAKNPSAKLVIFTESVETADSLTRAIKSSGYSKTLMISADNRKAMELTIRQNFDANYDPEKQAHDYDIIITTEVLAEGINLHRSNTIVNYDVPWNATRLMQRIGRVNRIGSTAKKVYVYNYFPSAEGDGQIRLVNKALRKLQAFHSAFGEDNRIFSLLEEMNEDSNGLFGGNIQREESEVLKYLNELRGFKKSIPNAIRKSKESPTKPAVAGRPTSMVSSRSQVINWITGILT